VSWNPESRAISSTSPLSEAVQLPGRIVDAAWGADGKLYLLRGDGAIERMAVGGTPERVAPPDSGWLRSGMSILPGERGALLVRARRAGADSASVLRTSVELVAVSFGAGKVTSIIAAVYGQYLETGQLLYVTDNGSVVVAPFDLEQLRMTGPGVPLFKVVMVTGFLGRGMARPQLAISSEGTLLYSPAGTTAAQQLVWLDPDGRERFALPLSGDVEGVTLSRRTELGQPFRCDVRRTSPTRSRLKTCGSRTQRPARRRG